MNSTSLYSTVFHSLLSIGLLFSAPAFSILCQSHPCLNTALSDHSTQAILCPSVRGGAAAVVGARARGRHGDAHGAGVAQGARRAAAPAARDLHPGARPAPDALRGKLVRLYVATLVDFVAYSSGYCP